MWVCLLKDEKGRIFYSKKEDATVKLGGLANSSTLVGVENRQNAWVNVFLLSGENC